MSTGVRPSLEFPKSSYQTAKKVQMLIETSILALTIFLFSDIKLNIFRKIYPKTGIAYIFLRGTFIASR
jgi:hypothetical protein